MKKYKQFRAEQQYIAEVGPFASAMMVAMGAVGLGVAGWKLFKAGKEKIKGYKEAKAEKKDNKDNGVYIDLKTWDDEAGKITTTPTLLAKAGTSEANMSNDEIEKKRKEKQKKLDPDNTRKQAEWEIKNKKKEDEEGAVAKGKKTKADAGKSVSDWMGHEPTDEIPDSMEPKVKEKERKKLGGHKDVIAYKDRWGMEPEASLTGWKKWYDDPEDKDDFEYVTTDEHKKKTDARAGQNESKLLSFGEFITEGVMNDLLKAGKSKKDSEISLDDGADIPIDPLTSQILVKYIEGLSSSEKNRTIQQIQRTERAFMKVLGKAHENT